jgi:tetratricopeptide (TPR) repeat protein
MGLAGHFMLGVGDYDNAVAILERMDYGDVPTAQVYSTLGTAYLRKGDLRTAEDLFYKAIEIDSGYTEALIHLGEIKIRQENPDEAITYFERAREVSPGFADVRYKLGAVYLNRERVEEAIAEFTEATNINSNFTDARIALSFALRRRGREEEALEQIDQVLAIDPGNVIALAQRQAFKLDRPTTGKQGAKE